MSEIYQRAKLRLIYLGIGLVVGLLVAGVVGLTYNEVMIVKQEAYEAQVLHLQQLSELKIRETERLLAENKELRTRKVERTNADGSKEVIEETAENSSSSSEERVKEIEDLRSQLVSAEKTYKEKLDMEQKKRPSFTYSLGINTQLTPYMSITYNFGSMFILQAYADRDATFGLGLGIQF
jgi:hypothetical protein